MTQKQIPNSIAIKQESMSFLDNAGSATACCGYASEHPGHKKFGEKNYIFRFAHNIEHPTQLILNTLHN